MNQNEDAQTGDRDPLRDRLHEDAMAERPPFSAEIHRRPHAAVFVIRIQSLHRLGGKVAFKGAAAAICFSAGALSIAWLVGDHGVPAPVAPAKIAGNPRQANQNTRQAAMAPPPNSIGLTLNIGDLISARLWPPEIAMRLPAFDAGVPPRPAQVPSPQASSPEPPGSPEWLLDRLQEPARSAQAALAGMMPPDVHALR